MWDEVGDGCFRRRYRRFDLNIGVVRGADALLVIDTRGDLRQADELLDDLACFGRPVRWVINSHWQFDHVFGNQRFVERARGAPTTSTCPTVEVEAELQLWGHVELPPMLLDNETELRAALREFDDDESCAEFDRVELVAPDHLVAERHVLDLGDRGVELLASRAGPHEQRPHRRGQRCRRSCSPATWSSSQHRRPTGRLLPAGVAGHGDRTVALGPSTFVPGHGDVMAPETVADQVAAIAAVAALSGSSTRQASPPRLRSPRPADQWPFPRQSLTSAVARGYLALGPQPTTR